ncbi:hypothetical protein [Paenibacillus lactis]|uniref:Uncharacterized protein n=1 Tax=Paenibacillus lactis TaxID=228574 RepID=A0ABS4FC45_9BACL|nr:hypothetical protein [Paenibacillus lactis]MBP1893830.1 hypothetical protein [Paenibacillus lactis]
MPVWHIATIYQPDVILWVKIMSVLMAMKGSMELTQLIRLIRSIRLDKKNEQRFSNQG